MSQDIVEKLGQFTDEQQSALRRVWEQRVLYTDHPDFKNRGFRDWILSDCHKGLLKLEWYKKSIKNSNLIIKRLEKEKE